MKKKTEKTASNAAETNNIPETQESATTETQAAPEAAAEEKQPAEDPIIKARRVKEKQMCTNMHVFLRAKGIDCQLTEAKEKPYFRVIGKSNTESQFNFQLFAHPEQNNEKNNPQVVMLIGIEENRYVKMHPQNNTHLMLLLQHHVPGIEILEPQE